MCVNIWFIQVCLCRPSVQVYVFIHVSVHGWSRVALSDKGHAGVRVGAGGVSWCWEGLAASSRVSVAGEPLAI